MGTRNAHNTIPSSSRIFDISSVECGDDKDDDDEDSDGGISTNCDSFSFHTALFNMNLFRFFSHRICKANQIHTISKRIAP